ncbi:ATP synthase [Lithospermum erythrorhizon]|uniref:V-type proton ATPase subunit G n=1 Tax=Lithospermum erythrorhizon TaxID=34254 RepID=A0AAV3RLG8_LITER
MDPTRGQGGIQMLLTAEQEAQQIVTEARNLKMARLRQAKDEAEKEVATYRTNLETDYRNQISQTSGDSDSTMKRLDKETEEKIENLKKAANKVSPHIVSMLTKHITSVNNNV